MRIDEIVLAIKKKQSFLQERIFSNRVSYDEYATQQGIWQGLNDALSIIQDAIRKDREHEDE